MKQSLNFSWIFIPNFKDEYLTKMSNEALDVNIPHTVKEVPYNYFSVEEYQMFSTYEKIFDVDDFDVDRRYFLRFDGFMVKAKIYLNGNELGDFVSGYVPVEIEVSEAIQEKNNRLIVVLDSHEDENIPPFGFALDYVTFGGIYREVSLLSESQTYLRNIYVHGDMNGKINISYDVVGNSKIKVHHTLVKNNKQLCSFEGNEYVYSQPILWDLEHPELYELHTFVENEEYVTRFGFRNAEFRKTGFYLNDKKVKLIGLNRHQGYPFIGYAATKSLQEDDANLLKFEVGANVVRTSHYPQSEHFLNRCDEIGLLVVNEIPGWQHIGKTEAWRNQCLENTKMMVLTERNHPCLIAHGIRIDESIDDHELYSKTNEIAHSLDPYRQTIGVRNFKNSEQLEDIYGYNDFICNSLKVGLDKPKTIKKNDKPLLITEYMGHMDPLKVTSDEEKRIEVSLRHAKVIDDCFKYENTAGCIGWCFVDYHSHADFGSGDMICAHGVFDLYRNPKYSSYIYASQQDNYPVLELLSNLKPGDKPEAIYNDIYIATNCDYIELYSNDQFVSKFYPKNDLFKYLKHPPIVIDDIVGETFKESKFPAKIHAKIAKMLSYAAIHGFGKLTLRIKLYLAYVMMRYKVSYDELVGYWNTYVGTWGGKAKTFRIKGYKDDVMVKKIEVGPSTTFDLEVSSSKNRLVNEETYDTARIRIRYVDEHRRLMQYAAKIIDIKTSGPIELIGTNKQSLHGGQLSLFVKSKLQKGEGKIIISVEGITKEIIIPVL